MRTILVAAAMAAIAAGCAPDSDKTNPAVATDETAAERAAAAPAAGANSFTQEQARERAITAGYTDIGSLTQAADGTWQGAAMKDGASVTVVVDYQGNVTTHDAGSSATTDGAASPTPAPSGAPTTPSTPPTSPNP